MLTPDEAIELIRGLGPDGRFSLNPLLAGIDPTMAWEMLDLFDREVLQAIDCDGRFVRRVDRCSRRCRDWWE